jgi:beta-lactamase class A
VRAPAPASPALQEAIARAAAPIDGRVAVTVQDLSTGARASLGGQTKLPMMSVFKLPLAVVALDAVDRGTMRLDQPVAIDEAELEDDDDPTVAGWRDGLHAPALSVVLENMLVVSDNTAADVTLRRLGGPSAIMEGLRAAGVSGIAIGEPELAIEARLWCIGVAAPAGGWTAAAVEGCKPGEREQAEAALREPEVGANRASSDAVVELLARLDAGSLLSEASRRWLLGAMAASTTGPRRLKGMLPPGTTVAHKTGTARVAGVTVAANDVGIVTLPDGRRFAIAVLLSGSRAELPVQEDAIARIARAAWDALATR